jgi:hypothetical protein
LSCFDEKREMVVDDELVPCPSQRGIEDLGGGKKTLTSSAETLEMVRSSEVVTSSGEELSQLTVNSAMLKNAKDLEIREMADRELDACTSKLDERCAEPDAAQCKVESGIDSHDDVLSQVEVEHAKKEAKKAYLQYLLSLAGDEQKRTTHNYLVWIQQEVEKQKQPYTQPPSAKEKIIFFIAPWAGLFRRWSRNSIIDRSWLDGLVAAAAVSAEASTDEVETVQQPPTIAPAPPPLAM